MDGVGGAVEQRDPQGGVDKLDQGCPAEPADEAGDLDAFDEAVGSGGAGAQAGSEALDALVSQVLEDRAAALEKLGFLLKRTGRRAEAVPLWEQWASFTVDEALPCVELSKYYEWKAQDLSLALRWAERAQAIILSQPPTWQRAEVIDAVTRRLSRLQEKHHPPA